MFALSSLAAAGAADAASAGNDLQPAKLSVLRSAIDRPSRTLDVLAPITRRASGQVDVDLHAAGERFRFKAPIDAKRGYVRFRKRIPAAQARAGTGIVTIRYAGSDEVRAQSVRLRAAPVRAGLTAVRPTLTAADRTLKLTSTGELSTRARGQIRLELSWTDASGASRSYDVKTRIAGGRWRLGRALPRGIAQSVEQRRGTVDSNVLFTGYLPARMRGEMRAYRILPAPAPAPTPPAVVPPAGPVSPPPAAPATPATPAALTWDPPQFEIATVPGSVTEAVVRFTYRGADIRDPAVVVSGAAGTALTVDTGRMSATGADTYELPVTITVPGNASNDMTGQLRLYDGGSQIGGDLPVRVVVNAPTGTPAQPTRPSPDRIVENADGVLVVVDELVIGVSDDESDPDAVARSAATATGAQIIGSAPRLGIYQLRYAGSTLEQTTARATELEAIDGIEFASLNVVDRDVESTFPNDSNWDSWAATPGGNNWGLEWINAPGAWDLTTGSSTLRIGVIDTDNDEDHGDLDDNVVNTSRGGAASGHGTHVGGTLCAEGNNGKGISGVMWDCELRYYAYGSDAVTTADAMRRAADDRNRVVNMSLQFIENNTAAPITPSLIELAHDTNDIFGRAVIYGQASGADVLWVFAAGNEFGRDVRYTAPGGLTARFPLNTIAVAAIGRNGELAGFSNTGDLVSVAAPGVDIYSTLPRTGCWFFSIGCDDNYGAKNGTSMAAPHVSGLAGLVLADDPSRSAADARACVVGGALSAGEAVPNHPFSVIDAPAAVGCEGTIDLPSKVDIVLAFDLTGSMGGVINQAKAEMSAAVGAVRAASPSSDIRYAVVSYEDYPAFFDSTPCGSSYSADYGDPGDAPFRIDSSLSPEEPATNAAIEALTLGSGSDGPESYGRAFWEIAQPDTAAALGLRGDALTLVVNFGDNVPHDTDVNAGVEGASGVYDTGIDPGRNATIECGGDDIDFQDDALAALAADDIRLLHVDSGSGFENHWRTWAAATGGAYTQLGSDRTLSEVIVELLGAI